MSYNEFGTRVLKIGPNHVSYNEFGTRVLKRSQSHVSYNEFGTRVLKIGPNLMCPTMSLELGF